MGDTNLHGVLNMPPECWNNDQLDQMQRHTRYVEASQRIEQQRKQIAIMREALQTIRSHGRRWPGACELATNAMTKAAEVA